MTYSKEHMVQRDHAFVIVDEVDSILIDEARTPLIISGPAVGRKQFYAQANEVAAQLEKGVDFEVDIKDRHITLSDPGIDKAAKLFGVENLYDGQRNNFCICFSDMRFHCFSEFLLSC
ncbi:MAG: hypothetical protein ACEQSE_14290 [Candidatus Aquirickettsiella gammari]